MPAFFVICEIQVEARLENFIYRMWPLAFGIFYLHVAATTVERPMVRREVKDENVSEAHHDPRGQQVHVTRVHHLHPAEVEAWNFLEVAQQRAVQAGMPEDESDSSPEDDVAEMQHADVDLDEAQEHGADPDLETDEATPEAAQVASVTSLLSKPGREAEAGKIEKAATPLHSQKHMEKPASKQKHIAGGHEEFQEQQKKVKIEKHVASRSKKASHKDGASNSNQNSKAELKNSTKTSSEDSEKMGSNSINGSDVLGAGISPNSSFMGQNDTKIQSNTSAQSFPETGDAEIPNSTGAGGTNAMPEANSQLEKVQDALRNAEGRAAKAEADLKAEKAWVANTLGNHGAEGVADHQEAQGKKEEKMKHEAALVDLAQVLMTIENSRDAMHKPLVQDVQDENKKMEDDAEEDESPGPDIDEAIREEKAQIQKRRMRDREQEDLEDDTPEDEDEDDRGSSALEEFSTEPPVKHKSVRHKRKSHKHKKGGFHVYVEADGGLLEQSSQRVPH